jgi:hypothetical protein
MAIATKVSTAERILAIDVGKYKSVACLYQASSGELQFGSFDTTRDELTNRFAVQQPNMVVIEACALSGCP